MGTRRAGANLPGKSVAKTGSAIVAVTNTGTAELRCDQSHGGCPDQSRKRFLSPVVGDRVTDPRHGQRGHVRGGDAPCYASSHEILKRSRRARIRQLPQRLP